MASTVWRGHLTFGLISVPVRLFRAARAERVPLRRVARLSSSGNHDGSYSKSSPPEEQAAAARPELVPVTQSPVAQNDSLVGIQQSSRFQTTGAEVPASSVTRAVEVQRNRFVEIPADELKKLKAPTSSEISIQEFVALSEIDPLYFETSYYVVPEEVGERAYALLYKALINTNVVALAEISMHGRDHVMVLRPGQTGLVAHTMFYVSEVHLDEQFQADMGAVSKKELDLAQTLVTSLTTTFEPEKYKNSYYQKLQDLVADRTSGSAESGTTVQAKAGADVVDIADALRRSLAQLKKPVQKSTKSVSEIKSAPRVKKAARTNG